jgi:hypothetical protein
MDLVELFLGLGQFRFGRCFLSHQSCSLGRCIANRRSGASQFDFGSSADFSVAHGCAHQLGELGFLCIAVESVRV